MAEYIEREALQKFPIWANHCDKAHADENFIFGIEAVLEYAKHIPTADVEPVRHARWDDSGRFTFPGGSTAVRCSGCGCALTVSEYRLNKWNYCPVCGARMDLGGVDDG